VVALGFLAKHKTDKQGKVEDEEGDKHRIPMGPIITLMIGP
jgi:hypothetical protein